MPSAWSTQAAAGPAGPLLLQLPSVRPVTTSPLRQDKKGEKEFLREQVFPSTLSL